jgi:hypothetical protein
LARLSTAAIQNGSRGEMVLASPPSAGPNTKPAPKATPSRPKRAARYSPGVTSAI